MSRSEDCLAGSHCSRLWLNRNAKCQGLKTAWQGHLFQALVKLMRAKCQGLKTAWQESLLPGSGWNRYPNVKVWRLLGRVTRSRLWLKHSAKCQGLKTAWQDHSFQGSGWNGIKPNVKVWRLLGKVTCSRLWSNLSQMFKILKTAWQSHSFQLWLNCTRQMSRSEDCLAESLVPGSG